MSRRVARLVVTLAGTAALALAAPGLARAAVPWCGSDQVATDRLPDAIGGAQAHVVYAIPSDGVDRFASVASAITSDVAVIDTWWRREDPARTPRFDLFAFPGCAPGFGQLDISFVRLAQPASAYHAVGTRLDRVATDLVTAGFSHAFKKYLVFYDGVVEGGNVCGTAYRAGEQGGRAGFAAVWLQAHPGFPGCGNLGLEDYVATTAAHELLHQLGALPTGAPHPCPGDEGHSCDSINDVMQGGGGHFRTLVEYTLDVGRDDYYGHAGSWLDAQDSAWLQRLDAPDLPLTVTPVSAAAEETIASDVPGIACPPACTTTLESGARVRLTATTRRPGRRFVGWRGACAGAGACELVVDAEKRVDAVFGPSTFQVRVRVAGRGRVTTTNFGCAATCAKALAAGKTFVFRARPAKGWRFVAWSGACRGRATCRVATTAQRQLVATFRRSS